MQIVRAVRVTTGYNYDHMDICYFTFYYLSSVSRLLWSNHHTLFSPVLKVVQYGIYPSGAIIFYYEMQYSTSSMISKFIHLKTVYRVPLC